MRTSTRSAVVDALLFVRRRPPGRPVCPPNQARKSRGSGTDASCCCGQPHAISIENEVVVRSENGVVLPNTKRQGGYRRVGKPERTSGCAAGGGKAPKRGSGETRTRSWELREDADAPLEGPLKVCRWRRSQVSLEGRRGCSAGGLAVRPLGGPDGKQAASRRAGWQERERASEQDR